MEITTDIADDSSTRKPPILSLAALFGECFSIDWLQALSGERASNILAAIDEGIRHSILKQDRVGVYSFLDPEEKAGLLVPFSEEQKAKLHRRAADHIRNEFPDETGLLPVVVHHLMNVTNDLDDCRTLYDAGEMFRRAYRLPEALKCYGRLVESLRLLEGEEADQIFVLAVYAHCRIFRSYENPREITSRIEEAISRATAAAMQPYKVLLEMHRAKNEWIQGRQAKAIERFDAAWRKARRMESPDVKRYAATLRMWFSHIQGRWRDVIDVYEEIAPMVSRYPRSQLSIGSTIALGSSIAYSGRFGEGVGMLSGLIEHCQDLGDNESLVNVLLILADIYIEIEDADRAMEMLRMAEQNVAKTDGFNDRPHFDRLMADVFWLKQEHEKSLEYLRRANRIRWPLATYRAIMDMDEDALLDLTGYTAEEISQSAIDAENTILKATGYFLLARRLGVEGKTPEKVLASLKLAAKWFDASGHELKLAKARFEMARSYLETGDREMARETMVKAHKVLAPINRSLVPEDLLPLLENRPAKRDLQGEISLIGQEIMTLRDNRELALRILAAVNQLSGAERGGIFLLENGSGTHGMRLAAARNLLVERVADPSFGPSMAVIQETISSGVGRIVKKMAAQCSEPQQPGNHQNTVVSCFCVPMVLKGEVIGALYHDNRLFKSAIEESDLNALTFLAAQVAVALDNARAYEKIRQLNQELSYEREYLFAKAREESPFKDLIGKTPAMQQVYSQISRVAGQDTVVVIQGETGVGKEMVARAIQTQSKRNRKPFISADCSAFSEGIITSELFGHEKGAFTGAQFRKAGRFELANGGTLFLDEIGNLPMAVQVQLLRVLQTREFQRVGGIEVVHSDFRLITATNKDLGEEVAAGRFREDLYYRLNVFPITVPPLRDRRDDIPLLALSFLESYSTKMGKSYEGIAKSEMEKLLRYPWPGNVRELRNVIERGTILSTGFRFKVPELTGSRKPEPKTETVTLAEMERRYILQVLEKTGGKKKGPNGAAELLGLHDSTLRSKMKKLGIKSSPSRTHLV